MSTLGTRIIALLSNSQQQELDRARTFMFSKHLAELAAERAAAQDTSAYIDLDTFRPEDPEPERPRFGIFGNAFGSEGS